jgi:hypothetical protein
LGVHERGSQGASGVTVEVGGWKAPLLEDDEEEDPVDPVELDTAVVGVPTARPPVLPDAPTLAAAGGGLTLKSVPVTTVTWEPGFTWEASSAMMTPPVMEFATACAAAISAWDFDE